MVRGRALDYRHRSRPSTIGTPACFGSPLSCGEREAIETPCGEERVCRSHDAANYNTTLRAHLAAAVYSGLRPEANGPTRFAVALGNALLIGIAAMWGNTDPQASARPPGLRA